MDPRTAPIRSGRLDENTFARQQQPYYQQQQQQSSHRSSGSISASTSGAPRSQDPRYAPDMGPRSARPQPGTADRRNFPPVSGHPHHSAHPSQGGYPASPHGRGPQSGPMGPSPSSARPSNGMSHTNGGYSASPSPPNMREQFLAPFSQLFDMLGSVDQLRFQLQDMLHRADQSYSNQLSATNEFKQTAAQASSLLSSLQQSADALKDMVRYEVDRSASADRREIDDLRERMRALEDMISHDRR